MTSEPPSAAGEETLFYEPGARWRWLLLGPLGGLAIYGLQVWSRAGTNLIVPMGMAVLVSFFLALQIYAARVHTSVRLTPTALYQGAETLDVSNIRWMYPDADRHVWEEARLLGAMSSIPKGRKAIGLKLVDGRRARAWARDQRGLRERLAVLVPQPPAGLDLGDGPKIDEEKK